jgi:hypothetical protein
VGDSVHAEEVPDAAVGSAMVCSTAPDVLISTTSARAAADESVVVPSPPRISRMLPAVNGAATAPAARRARPSASATAGRAM